MYTSFCESGQLFCYYFLYFTYGFVEIYYIKYQHIVWHATS